MQLTTPAETAGQLTNALRSAAQATGAGFDYLVRTAKRESALNPAAQNPNSSARGLFQFIDSTWLEVLKEEGAKLGLGDAAAAVQKNGSGRYTVADPAKRAELLAMRDDPQASALLAGAFTRRNADRLTSALGRAPSEGELYAAHFLGAQGAAQLVSLASASPDASAAAAFPAQASANRAIFFENGRPRSASEIYARLTAGGSGPVSVPSIASSASRATAATVRVAQVEEPTPLYNNGVENDGEAFHSLFKTGRRSPVSSYVAQAWSSFGEAGMAADVASLKATSETIAPAYAAQPAAAAAPLAPKPATAASAALDAVNAAAAPRRRRILAPASLGAAPAATPASTPGGAATPAADASAQSSSPGAANQTLAAASPGRQGGLIAFLKSVLNPPAEDAPVSANARTGGRP